LLISRESIFTSLEFWPYYDDSKPGELFSSKFWRDRVCAPWASYNLKSLYANEMYQIKNSASLFYVTTFAKENGVIVAIGYPSDGVAVDCSRKGRMDLSNLAQNVLPRQALKFQHAPAYFQPRKSYREKARGVLPVYNLPIILFADDTAGNISKKFNKLESWFFQVASLPFRFNQLEENIHFILTSNNTTAAESGYCIARSMRKLRDGIIVKDASGEDVILTSEILFLAADGPAHSDLLSSNTLQSKFPCRMCFVQSYSETEDFLSAEYASKPTAARAKRLIVKQWDPLMGDSSDAARKQARETLESKGVRDVLFNKATKEGSTIPDPEFRYNPLFGTAYCLNDEVTPVLEECFIDPISSRGAKRTAVHRRARTSSN
jgi:hypothetical protein